MELVKRAVPFLASLKTIQVNADQVQIIDSTPLFREKLIELIETAQHRIYLTALYLQDDAAGQQILNAIYQAKQKRPNLDVKIFVDFIRAQRGLMGHPESVGNVRLYRECAEKYEHQIDILGVPVKSKEVFGVLHLKGFIFDDQLLYSGSSINDVYLQMADKYRIDRYHLIGSKSLTDSMVKYLQDNLLEEKAVCALTSQNIPLKKQLLPAIRQLKKNLRKSEYHFSSNDILADENSVSMTPLLGFGGRKNLLNKAIFELVKNTKQQITIYTPYFNLPSKINKAVTKLLKKGMHVEIIVGDKTANDFFISNDKPFNRIGIVPYVYETNLRKFAKQNQKYIDAGLLDLQLWLDAGNTFHLKGISVDKQLHLITGHNINPRAWRLDIENGIVIQDPQELLLGEFEREHATIMRHTTRINSFTEIEMIKDYPDVVKKLMRRVKGAKLDSILNRLL